MDRSRRQGQIMLMQGLDGADIILLIVFFYVSYKLYKRAKKESEDQE